MADDGLMPLTIRISRQEMERLEALARRRPGMSKGTLARDALQLGMEALDQKLISTSSTGATERSPSETRENLQKLKTRLDRLESQVKEFFDSQATTKKPPRK